MAMTAIPSQDLAKLVLGYLNEEQLLTVYDEMLQASPYLDAPTNEYARLGMQSLRSILNDYWRMKLCVEKCKPFALRKKLLQLQTNNSLLDVVKFLISHVDLRKIPNISPQDRIGLRTQQNMSTSLTSVNCSQAVNNSNEVHGLSEATPSNTVDATSLMDLPGSTKRKQVKVLERDSSEAERLMSDDPSDSNGSNSLKYSSSSSAMPHQTAVLETTMQSAGVHTNLRTPAETHLNVQNLDQILSASASKNCCVQNSECIPKVVPQSVAESITSRTSAASFQDFATGVEAGTHVNMSIPDSSTSETSSNFLLTSTLHPQMLSSHVPKATQHLIRVNTRDLALVTINAQNSPVEPKPIESKITILSDVKVNNNKIKRIAPKPPILENAASTPMGQMQTIMINGTPAYKPQSTRTFTKDEIMDMQTIFLVTVPGPPPSANSVKTSKSKSKSSVSVTSSTHTVPSLPSDVIQKSSNEGQPTNEPGETKNMLLLNTTSNINSVSVIDLKNASVPKECTISKTSTPQCLPISRKSSSTPRRTSHIRVLDFATPRRILHEAISENGENPVEVILSQSPSTHNQPMSVESFDTKTASEIHYSISDDDNSSKEKTVCPPPLKKHNWDADLRALCVQPPLAPVIKPKAVKKKKKPPEKPQNSTESDESTKKPTKSTKNSSKQKTKKTKKNDVVEMAAKVVAEPAEVVPEPAKVVPEPEVPVKPTTNIVTDWETTETDKTDKTENKSSGDNQSDTPDMNRTCLQNVICAKLNISDFLETPYKQALYDIQMETPRFLRPDIPMSDEPVSEVKISDIPTPRFFDTPGFAPKPGQGATPSSYNSRPTDYSSGSSYYKPDEQDYTPHPDDLGCPVLNTGLLGTDQKDTSPEMNEKQSNRTTRPVRQCTKNVSYNYSESKRPAKDAVVNESSDDAISVTSMEHCKEEDKDKVTGVTEKLKKPTKERRKSTSKKHKSPVKKATPKFMKIKPRRPTPEKVNKRKSNTSELSHSRKRTSSKEKTVHSTPPVIPAPTKSRRKSSTPRKLHTKVISPSPESSESVKEITKSIVSSAHDSDTENLPLRWSDEGSQDNPVKLHLSPVNEEEDISKIQDYIEKSRFDKSDTDKGNESAKESGSLQSDLVKTGSDIETARSIERVLLDSPQITDKSSLPKSDVVREANKQISAVERNFEVEILDVTESDSSITNHLQITQEEGEDVDDIELSCYECNEECNINYFVSEHIESTSKPKTEHHKLKDNYMMEILEEDLTVTLKATNWMLLIDEPKPLDDDLDNIRETEEAVNSIPNFDRLYTPLKHHRPAPIDALIEVFDSSLTSLDTPLKATSPKNDDSLISEIVIEVESVEKDKGKGKGKKRRRIQSDSGTDESQNEPKRNRPEILPDIHNIDIESVLTQLHGP